MILNKSKPNSLVLQIGKMVLREVKSFQVAIIGVGIEWDEGGKS